MRVVVKEFNETSVILGFVFKCIRKFTILLILIVAAVNYFPDRVAAVLSFTYKFVPEIVKNRFQILIRSINQSNDYKANITNYYSESEDLNRALQIVLIQVSDWDSNVASLQRYSRGATTESWLKVGETMRVVVDYDGLGWSDRQAYKSLIKEGDPIRKPRDKRSPAGVFRLRTAFGTYLRQKDLNVDYRSITGREYCVYESSSRNLNKLVDFSEVSASEVEQSVKMLNREGMYNLGVMIEYPRNISNPEHLSCLFLYSGPGRALETYGSVEVNQSDLEHIVYWLDRDKNPVLVQLVSRDVKPVLNLEPIPAPPPPYAQTAYRGR